MIKIFGKIRYHWQPELSWSIIYWSLALTPMFIGLSLLYERTQISVSVFVLFILVVVLFGIGFHRYFRIDDEDLLITYANPFRKQKIKIDSIQKIEVTFLYIKLFSEDFPHGKIFYMRKWPKKYFINDLVRNLSFKGEIILMDHLIKQDYFEEYYSESAKSVR
ncbi:EbsA family protein [Streptococcus cameli]